MFNMEMKGHMEFLTKFQYQLYHKKLCGFYSSKKDEEIKDFFKILSMSTNIFLLEICFLMIYKAIFTNANIF